MTLRIPAAHLPPGPGGFSAGVDLVYNSTIFDLKTQVPTDNPSVLQMEYVPSTHGGGWKYGYKTTLWAQPRVSVFTTATCGAVGSQTEAKNWYKTILATPDGANRPLRLVGALNSQGNSDTSTELSSDTNQSYDIYDFAGYTNLNCGLSIARYSGTLIFVTSDSTYIRVEANTITNTWKAFFPDGSLVSGPIVITAGHAVDSDADLVTDRNGNTLSISGNCSIGASCTETLTDGQGRNVTIAYSSSASGTWTDTITWPGPPSSPTLTTTVNWTSVAPFQLAYYCRASASGATNTASYCSLSLSPAAVSSIQLPSVGGVSTNFLANYNPVNATQSWGELHRLEVCSGPSPTSCGVQWKEEFIYQFDTLTPLPSSKRPPGTVTNPIAKKILTYNETLSTGTTSIPEETTYTVPVPSDAFTYPTSTSNPSSQTSPSISASQVTYPDGSYAEVFTANLCPSSLKSRDLCVAVPYKVLNRDGSFTEMQWASNSAPPGVPASAYFNPYVTARVATPLGRTMARVQKTGQDWNGNTTLAQEYDWVAASAVVRDSNTGIVTSVCGAGTTCSLLRQTTTAFNSNGQFYWQHTAGPQYLRAPQSVTTTGGVSATFSYDNALTTANLQQMTQSDNGVSVNASWSYVANGHGNLQTATDPKGNVTQIAYGCSGVYPSTVTAPGSFITTYTVDCTSGLATSVVDPNAITTAYTYDNLGRATKVEEKSGTTVLRTTDTIFNDYGMSVQTQRDDGAARLVNTTYFDPLGRVRLTSDGLNQQIQKAYRYGTNGESFELVSNPFSSGGSPSGWTLTKRTLSTPNSAPTAATTTAYDGATPPAPWGNNTIVAGSAIQTSNVAAPATATGCGGFASSVQNAAGHLRYNCIDGLGRLSAVLEPNGMLTQYGYNAQDNLTGVSAECLAGYTCSPSGSTGQTRTFTYRLSRLMSATNPESGTVSYTYDNNGNMQTRTDANGTIATITYDTLDRPTGVTYTAGTGVATTPPVTYGWDTSAIGAGFKGALTSVTSSASIMQFAYDTLGRIVTSRQTTGGPAYTFGYQYSLTDRLTQITYPSGRKVDYTLDAADQVTELKGTPPGGSVPTPYASGITYTAAGDLSTLPFYNGVTETHTWNSRLQQTGISAGNLLSLTYDYCSNGAGPCASGNTGSPWQQTIAVGGQTKAVQRYVHDSLNRLQMASEKAGTTSFTPTCPDSGSEWCRQYSYDNAGNRSLAARSPSGSDLWDAGVVDANNRFLGWGYDSAGNVKKVPVVGSTMYTLAYDGENRQVAFCTNMPTDQTSCPNAVGTGRTLYAYDGLGNRVQRTDQIGNATTYVYDAFGNLAAEYGGPGSGPAGTQYVTVDALGSTRLLMAGTQATERHDFQPFGTEIGQGTWRPLYPEYAANSLRQKFTGQERDGESTLDFFHARYFSGAQGRFLSPDPGNAGAMLGDPQSWNAYAYVGNNPLAYTDPDGLMLCATCVGSTGGPVGTIIGAAIDIGAALFGIFGFGGGSQPDLSPIAHTPVTLQPSPQLDMQGWNSQGPVDGPWEGTANNGTLFGSGNTGPFIFSAAPTSTWPGIWPGTWSGTLSGIGQSIWGGILGGVMFDLARRIPPTPANARGMTLKGDWVYAKQVKPKSQAGQESDLKKAFDRYRRACGKTLDRGERRTLHDAITGQDFDVDDIVETMKQLFGCPSKGR